MKSDIIKVSSREDRVDPVLDQAERAAAYRGLRGRSALQLRLLAEEMMSMMRSVVGEVVGEFWIESEGDDFELHLRAETNVDAYKREKLLSAATSGKNEAERGFMGKLRAFFAPAEGAPVLCNLCPDGMFTDMTWTMSAYQAQIRQYIEQSREGAQESWDELEKSVVAHVADEVKVSIRDGHVEMTVFKRFE